MGRDPLGDRGGVIGDQEGGPEAVPTFQDDGPPPAA